MTRILIVDDNQKNLYLLEAIMKGNGYEVVTAVNGADALATAKKDPPDLIITDILMPVMDGFELCRRWKADEQLNHIPFIFYTATYTDSKDEDFARSLGAERFIVKPQKPDALVSEIKTVLEVEKQVKVRPQGQPHDEKIVLEEYSKVLFHKLEKKVKQLEEEIAERKALEQQREEVIKELEQKNAELERFTYTVSHDLKSPLITIQGFSGMLQEDVLKGDNSRIKEDIDRIVTAADKMQELLEDLLALSCIGRIVNPSEEVPLENIVHEAVDRLEGPITESGVTIEIAPDLPAVCVDHARVLEVYINLIENAIKFMYDQESPLVRIGIRNDRERPVFFVQDNGMGIEQRYLSKIFGQFEKLNAKSEGTGIGLAIVKRIIEVHGGEVWAESEGPGQGTTFCFTLPTPQVELIDKK